MPRYVAVHLWGDYVIGLEQMLLGKGIPDEFAKSQAIGSLDLFFWKWPLLDVQAPSWNCLWGSWAPTPLACGDCRDATFIFEENDFIDQDSSGFLPDTQGAGLHQNGGLWFEWRFQWAICNMTEPTFPIKLEKPQVPLGFYFFAGNVAFCLLSWSLPACGSMRVCTAQMGITSLLLPEGPGPSVAPNTLIRRWYLFSFVVKRIWQLPQQHLTLIFSLTSYYWPLGHGALPLPFALHSVCRALLLCLLNFGRPTYVFFLSDINKSMFLKEIK